MKYMLLCSCGMKLFTDGSINLIEIKNAPLPLRANGKSTETRSLPKRFKCSQCGYVLKPVNLKQEEEKIEKTVLEEEQDFQDLEREINHKRQKRLGDRIE